MASMFETAGIDDLNGAFWSQTNTYSVVHLNSCWGLVKSWLDGITWLTFQSDTSTYFDENSLTELGKIAEEAKYRDYLVEDFNAPLPLVMRIRISYKGNRDNSYKNIVVIECQMSYGATRTPWSYIDYNDPNPNSYTNNRQMGTPYLLYLSDDRKAICFTQGIFLSSQNSTQGHFPMPNHGMFLEYNDADSTLYGDYVISTSAVDEYYLAAYSVSFNVGKNCEHRSFKISANALSATMSNYLPTRSNTTATQHSNSFGYVYKNFIAITEPGFPSNGFNVQVDGVKRNYAPLNFGISSGTSPSKGRLDARFILPNNYFYFPIGASCIYALVD